MLERNVKRNAQRVQGPLYWSRHRGVGMSWHFKKVDVTDTMIGKMQELFDITCNPSTLGHGRDQRVHERYNYLRVVSVTRIEHATLWRKYSARQHELEDLAHQRKPRRREQEPVKTDQVSWVRDAQLNGRLNEKLLFHGTNAEVSKIIAKHGFDERVGAASGRLFGDGMYFAENSSKADQYVEGDSSREFCMFVTRVTLGTALFVSKTGFRGKRPPDLTGTGAARGRIFDAVLGKVSGKYQEYIVFDRAQCYPEYLVNYRREKR